jgi:hypothetical protein
MAKPPVSYRRIDKFKTIAYTLGFTDSDAKQFGKLSKTATWEALLELYFVGGESPDTVLDLTTENSVGSVDIQPTAAVDNLYTSVGKRGKSPDTSGWTHDASFHLCGFSLQEFTSFNFLQWVDFGQLIALALASASVFVLAMNMWRQINPLNLLPSPVRINIQIRTK